MRILFIGTVKFSYFALEKLLQDGAEIVAVCTKENTGLNADYADLRPLCELYNIPFKIVRDINHPNNVQFIRALSPDVIYCFGWSNLLKAELLNLTPLGVIGYHPAALPDNRGRHPLIWALVLALETTASTFFFMDEGADSGDILSQKNITITPQDDAGTLYEKMINVALRQISDFTVLLRSGKYPRTPQQRDGNSWRKRGKADGRIDFRMHTQTIYNLVRALTRPYVGAHIETAQGDIKIWQSKPVSYSANNIEPGKVLALEGQDIYVKTADAAIILTKHEFLTLPSIGSYL